MISPYHYVDYKSIDKFFQVEPCKIDPKEMANIFKPTFYMIYTLIMGQMRKMEIREEEVIGLVGLILWDDSSKRRQLISFDSPLYSSRI